MLILLRKLDGTLASQADTPNECVWLLTDYTEQPCDPDLCDCPHHTDYDAECEGECVSPFECAECGQEVYGGHYVNMDNGAECAHPGCVDIIDQDNT